MSEKTGFIDTTGFVQGTGDIISKSERQTPRWVDDLRYYETHSGIAYFDGRLIRAGAED